MRSIYSELTLTPALSLRERENPPPSDTMSFDGQKFGSFAYGENRRWLSPLPVGEGQGEGEPPNYNPSPKNL
jgi:hypothetical protein